MAAQCPNTCILKKELNPASLEAARHLGAGHIPEEENQKTKKFVIWAVVG
jgi:hypothetical protein